MTPRLISTFVAACAVFFSSAQRVPAEDFWMLFQNHRVTLIVRDVTVSRILEQWARIGGTTVVHADAVQGGPITLRLIDVPEREALEVLLRGADGYIISEREDGLNSQSTIDRILVLAKTAGTAVGSQLATAEPAAPVSNAQADERVIDSGVQSVEPTPPGVTRTRVRNVDPAPPGVATVTNVGGMRAVVPPTLPPGTFVGLGTISTGPGQAPQTVPMLFRQGTGATERPGETPAPVPITQLSPGPEPQQ